ncbi:MAG: quinone-dependent dihydroorotate dehydrogenase [Patescibacteria group bacterium]
MLSQIVLTNDNETPRRHYRLRWHLFRYNERINFMLYKSVLKPLFFRFEPEFVHERITAFGEFLGKFKISRWVVNGLCHYEHRSLETEICGIKFKNPVGLSAGFDKDVRLTRIIPEVGFGFMEVGAITQFPYSGNPGRRLLRLPKDNALIVYYGLKNIGADAVYKKIQKMIFKIPVGINIAKTNRDDIKGEDSVKDYVNTYRLLSPYFAYSTINISCPNAQDGCSFQDNAELLRKLLSALSCEKKSAPIFLKISNHLSESDIDRILNVVDEYKIINGFIVSNLSKDRASLNLKSSSDTLDSLPLGGISGKPIQQKTDRLISYIYQKTGGKYVIVGVGGIFTAEDAYKKIKAGASLVQLITGMVYGGPLTIKRINQGLVNLLKDDGYNSIGEAIGKDLFKADFDKTIVS